MHLDSVIWSRRVADPGTPEWNAARLTGIGASEAAAALGESTFSTPFKLYAVKCGLIPPMEDTDAMRLGRKLEQVGVTEYAHRNGVAVRYTECPMLRHPDYPFILATPDAVLENDDLLEIKTTTWRTKLGEQTAEGDAEIPPEWVCQAQQQMLVTETQRVHFGVLVDGRGWKQYTIERDEGLIEAIIAAESELWDRIQRRDPPDPDWHHPSTADVVRKMFDHVSEGETVQLSGKASMAWDAYERLGKQIKQLESDREGLKSRVLAEIGAAEAGVLCSGDRMVRRKRILMAERIVKAHERLDVRAVKVRG